MLVEAVNSSNLSQIRRFLNDHAETTLFLSSNLAAHGLSLGEHPNSGDYMYIRNDAEVLGVFCLTRRGNLLVELAGRVELAGLVLGACHQGEVAIRGVLGEWASSSAVWRELTGSGQVVERLTSREVLFRLQIGEPTGEPPIGVRRLEPNDFEAWSCLNSAYACELGLSENLTEEQRRLGFADSASAGHWWGYFLEKGLVSIAGLNARHGPLGQVGGVFTRRDLRRRGYSRAVMQQLLSESHSILGLSKLILFTDQENTSARGLYRSLGFEEIGEFGMMFGERRRQTVAPNK
jgi:ribosomal protein S18 acetylase RimI-like enzyme